MTWSSWSSIIWGGCETNGMCEDVLGLGLIVKHCSECDNFLPYKSCNFQCHPSGEWHCSVGLSLMQLSAKKRLVPESCKVQEAEQNRKEEKSRKKKVLECLWSPLQAVGCTGSENHTFAAPQGERGLAGDH